jgi:CRISPR-associated protein Csd1
MYFRELYNLYPRLATEPAYGVPVPGFSQQKIVFKIVLRPNGKFVQYEDIRTEKKRGKKTEKIPRLMLVPSNGARTINIVPQLLWDNTEYLLGQPGKPTAKKDAAAMEAKARARFEACRDYHLGLESTINHPDFSAVCTFLRNWDPARDLPSLPGIEKVEGFGVFELRDAETPVHDLPEVQAYWLSIQKAGNRVGQCAVSGLSGVPIADLHPKIKNFGAEVSFVSFNDPSHEAFGHRGGENASVSEAVAFRYGAALNALLLARHRRHTIRIGETTYVFWTDRPSLLEDVWAAVAGYGDEEPDEKTAQDETVRRELEVFFRALKEGRQAYGALADDPDRTRFFILGLSVSTVRLVVRSFYSSSVTEFVDHLQRYRRDLQIVKDFENDPDFPSVWRVVAQTHHREVDPSPLLSDAVLRSILEGLPYPQALYYSILRRVHVDRDVNYLKSALLKAVLTRNYSLSIPMALDETNTSIPYNLGRKFAVHEKLQYDASDGGVSSIKSNYFAMACSNPASVFPRIEKLSACHLRDLTDAGRIHYTNLLNRIGEVFPAEGFPAALNPVEQGIFLIGYRHQMRKLWEKRPTEEKNGDEAAKCKEENPKS